MIEKLQRRFALSRKGAMDVIKGSLFSALQNISFMLPVSLLYCLVRDMFNNELTSSQILFYVIGSTVCAVFIVICTAYQYNSTFLATYVETGVRRISLAEKLRKIPLSFFGKKDLADLTSSIMNDCAVLETSQSHAVCPLIGAIISTTLISLSLLFFNWKMALSSIWVLPVAFAIIAFASGVQKKLAEKSMTAKIACEDGIQECMETMHDLRANNAEKRYIGGLVKKIRQVETRLIKSELGTAVFVVSAGLVLRLGIATTALAGAYFLTKGEIDILTFFMFLLVASRLYDPLEGTLQNLAAIIATNSNIERMNEIMDYSIQSGSDKLKNKGCDICFENVGFSYNDGEKVLDNVSFTAKQGEVTALVGPSGGGKTTISRLAARFWDINKGKITVGGMDISKIDPEALMSLYSIVFQDVTLFNNTVMENIRLGKKDATYEEVIAAAKLANVDEFVEKLPDKWNSNIGENGCELSGGERQRISIARAFLKDAPIILLDEATASLDVENETAIQTALSRLIKNKTVMIIAHRMRTVSGADKIVVLKDGVVAEQGRPDKLLEKKGIFSHMVELQTESQNWSLV